MNYANKPSKLTWEYLGDMQTGRATLGAEMPVEAYRLLQYSLRDVLEREYDDQTAKDIFFAAGLLAGGLFAHERLDLSGDFDHFLVNLRERLRELKIGILNVEKINFETMETILTISEDLDCSGLPISGNTVCDYDEGFISGILEAYSGRKFAVREIDCWATGDRTCRFEAGLA